MFMRNQAFLGQVQLASGYALGQVIPDWVEPPPPLPPNASDALKKKHRECEWAAHTLFKTAERFGRFAPLSLPPGFEPIMQPETRAAQAAYNKCLEELKLLTAQETPATRTKPAASYPPGHSPLDRFFREYPGAELFQPTPTPTTPMRPLNIPEQSMIPSYDPQRPIPPVQSDVLTRAANPEERPSAENRGFEFTRGGVSPVERPAPENRGFQCPPGQFVNPNYPERGCQPLGRGGLPGLPGLTSGSATVTPGSIAPTGGIATSFSGMGQRFPVMNVI